MQRIGPYELLAVLGQGGMGTVHKVRHVELGAVRALKLLLAKRGGSQADAGRMAARFAREAQVLASVRHENVVGIHDSGVENGAPWFAMDLVEGTPLDKLLEDGRLPLERALPLMIDVCRGVDALHEAGIVHRDLKPGNIIVTPTGRPVVIDLGLAVAPERDERLTVTGAMVGTPNYMAPEQIEGRNVTPRTDVHALGLILYEVLTGAVAIGEGHTSVHQVVGAVIAGDRPRPSDRDAELPVAVDAVCARAMARDPARRFARAGDLAAALEAVAARPGPTRRSVRSKWLAITGVLAVLVVALAVAVGALAKRRAAAGAADAPVTSTSGAAPPQVDDLPTRELRAVRGEPNAARRREKAQAWLAKHGAHPAAAEARAIARDAGRQTPLARLDHGKRGLTLGAFVAGGRALTAGADGKARLWAARDGGWDPDGEWEAGGEALTLGRTADLGRVMLSVKGGWVRRFKADAPQDGAREMVLLQDLTAIGARQDGELVAAALDVQRQGHYNVRLIEIAEKRAVTSLGATRAPIRAVAITMNGTLLTASGAPVGEGEAEHALVSWDVSTGAERWRMSSVSEVSCLAVSPDERLVACGNSAGQLFLASVMVGPDGDVRELRGAGATRAQGGISHQGAHGGGIKALAFSADGARLYSVSDRGPGAPGGELRAWSVAGGHELREAVLCPLPGTTLDVTPDGALLLLSTRDGRCEVWSAAVD